MTAEQPADPDFRAVFADAQTRIRLRRDLTGLPQRRALSAEEIARRMGVRPNAVTDYERGESNPALSFVQRYARAVGSRVRLEIEEER